MCCHLALCLQLFPFHYERNIFYEMWDRLHGDSSQRVERSHRRKVPEKLRLKLPQLRPQVSVPGLPNRQLDQDERRSYVGAT
jgi:hypothetical protein